MRDDDDDDAGRRGGDEDALAPWRALGVRDAVAHKLSSGEVGNDVFAAAAAYVSKALARDALCDFVASHRDDSLLLASL